jgi:hypothetical protein
LRAGSQNGQLSTHWTKLAAEVTGNGNVGL